MRYHVWKYDGTYVSQQKTEVGRDNTIARFLSVSVCKNMEHFLRGLVVAVAASFDHDSIIMI